MRLLLILMLTSCQSYNYLETGVPPSPQVEFEYPESHGHCVLDPDNCYGENDAEH